MTLHIEFGFDLGKLAENPGALSFTLTETGGGGATGSVSINEGTHFLTQDASSAAKADPDDGAFDLGYTPIAPVLKAAAEAIGAATYTLTFNTTTERWTFSASGGGVTSFAISGFSETARRVLGFTTNRSGSMSYVADRAPYYWIKTSEGGLTDYFRDEEGESEIGEDLRSHGADVYFIDQDELPVKFDAVIPFEPRAKLWTEDAPTSTPFTWQRAFRHVRGGDLVALDFDNGAIAWTRFLLFRKEGRRFAPIARQGKNTWTYGDVPIRAWELGRIL